MVASWRVRRLSKNLSALRVPAHLEGVGWVGGDASRGDPWADLGVMETIKRGDRSEMVATQQRLRDDNLQVLQKSPIAERAQGKRLV